MIQYLREIYDLAGDDRRKLPWLVLLFLASSVLDLLGVGLVGPFVALVVDPKALDSRFGHLVAAAGIARDAATASVAIGSLLVAVFVVKGFAGVAIQHAISRFSRGSMARLQSRLMRSYQRLPYVDFIQRNSAENIYAIGGLTSDYATVVQIGLRMLGDAIIAVALLIFLAWQDVNALALLAALLAIMLYGYDRYFKRKLPLYGDQANQSAVDLMVGVQEGLQGLKEIRILGNEEHFRKRVESAAQRHARLQTMVEVIGAAPRHLLELAIVAFVVIFAISNLRAGNDTTALLITLGMFGIASVRLLPVATAFSRNIIELRYKRDSVRLLHRDLLALSEERLEGVRSPAAGAPDSGFRSLVLDRVRFTYPRATRPAVADLSLEIRADESVGLIGPSGSGKTTLVDVILGLLSPQEGAVRYNGRPLGEALAMWRSHVAYLPQEVFLIDNTLRCNVALGVDVEDIDEARVLEALQQARLASLVSQLPDGIDTMLGERGVRLSGGQRQRVALARAFYHGREVLVMDEATSALDTETEREIVEEIRQLKGHKTLIVIAHRLTTVQHCDRICRLEDGRIVEEGAYGQVVRG